MAYVTVAKIRIMCNKIGTTQVADNEISDFIAKATSRMEPILATRYRLPLPSPTPGIIESIAQDFTASFVLEKYYGGTITKEQTPLAKIYFDRAENDLRQVVELGLIDNVSGVTVVSPPAQQTNACMQSTTYRKKRSDMNDALAKF